MTNSPTVTVAIPVLNEEVFIRSVLDKFLNNTYPHITEIIVADGGSTDRTRAIVQEIQKEHPKVKLIENPDRKQAAGMNRIIEIAEGDLIVRADGHSEYADDYVEKCVEVMKRTDALNVSGSQRHVAMESFQAGVALASRTWFGNGGAHYKDPEYEGPSDTVFLGCFRTEVLREIGGYKLLDSDYVNEDAELNARLRKRKPDSVFVSPEIKVWYFPRNTPASLWRQYYYYGKSRKITQSVHPEQTPFRSLLPFYSVSVAFLLCIIDLILITGGMIAGTVATVGLLATAVASARVVLRFRKNFIKEFWRGPAEKAPGLLHQIISTWTAILIMLFAHFSGTLIQKLRLFRKSGSDIKL